MDSMAERLTKLREERLAREKARIAKLRELNLKKYNQEPVKNTPRAIKHVPSNPAVKNSHTTSQNNIETNSSKNNIPQNTVKNSVPNTAKNNIPQNSAKEHIRAFPKPQIKKSIQAKTSMNQSKIAVKDIKTVAMHRCSSVTETKPAPIHRSSSVAGTKNTSQVTVARRPLTASSDKGFRKSLFADKRTMIDKTTSSVNGVNKTNQLPNSRKISQPASARKSMVPNERQKPKVTTASNVSVFERLYKPKMIQKTQITEAEKLKTDPSYLQKAIQKTGLILNRRHTVFDNKPERKDQVRRSISAVHLKRINKNELANCIHKWASIGDKLNVDLKQINEDDNISVDRVVSAIKSERKKVTFMTPSTNFNTPKPEELQSRLKAWLQKRGKALDSYHHLQCFGIYHLPHNLKFDPKLYADEDKENICVESDTDDDSYTENMNEEVENKITKWRTASVVSDSVDFNESQNTTLTCSDGHNTDEIVVGALSDLTDLLKEGFDWMQCARWLRAIRERFPSALNSAAYWECRAALEERRGDLPASVKCWEEAIIQGTQHSVVEANLDQLLDKFMQLQISPNSEKSRQVDPKFVDVKNVFKSTIIRFAVQQAKLRVSNQETPGKKYCVTPVRRSARLSGVRTPLQLCTSVHQAPVNTLFVRNQHLNSTP